MTPGRTGLLLGLATFLAVVLTLGGPGTTVDEPLDVRPGRTYLATLRAKGIHFFDPSVVDRVFRDNAEHPPLGRWLLGIASVVGEPFEVLLRGPDPVGVYVRSGRLAPAAAFAVLVGVVATTAGRRYGRAAGTAAGLALALMPRAFAHAHNAALDTFTACFWTLALLHADRAIRARRPVAAMALAGTTWALALLTKIHAWLLPPVVLVWALNRLPWRRALLAQTVWTGVGLTLYVLGWPWLWYDPLARLQAYLGTGVERTTIYVQYFHTVYADRDVPWHYPWLYFGGTVPIGLHALGMLGVVRAWRTRRDDAFPVLLAGAVLFLLVLFSTRVPVYDGERLFLPVFPLWALFAGLGFEAAWRRLETRRLARAALVTFLLAQGYGIVVMHPFGLSYYNLLVGGLRGAERLGLELTFWGDAVDDRLLDRLAHEAHPGQTAALAPTLAPNQGLYATTPRMARFDPPLLLQDEGAAATADWIVVYRRTAYWKPEIRSLTRQKPLVLHARQGVWLSGLWRRPHETFKPN
jgi:4-amino-4-deoxy-L-arabinose transferase-like glycosyltransferase